MAKQRTPKTCPVCGAASVIPYVYGEPTAETGEEADRGILKIGGCVIFEDNPRWHCKACKHDWGRLEDEPGWFPKGEK